MHAHSNTGDIVLIGLREFQEDKADVIGKYTAEEARNLQAYGELPSTAKINQTAIDMAMDGGDGQEEDMGFDFDEVNDVSCPLDAWGRWIKYVGFGTLTRLVSLVRLLVFLSLVDRRRLTFLFPTLTFLARHLQI